jgi:hypothetical protein
VKNEYWATEVEVSRLGAAAWTTFALGRHEDALSLMRSAADIEDRNEKHIVTPARLVPAREMLGEMLLELKRPAEALKECGAADGEWFSTRRRCPRQLQTGAGTC